MKELLNSKKATMALIGMVVILIGYIIAMAMGEQIPWEAFLGAEFGVIATYQGAQAVTDFGKEKAKIEANANDLPASLR